MKNFKKIIITILITTLSMICIGSMSTFGSAELDGTCTLTESQEECLRYEVKKLIEEENLTDSCDLRYKCLDLLQSFKDSYEQIFKNPLVDAMGSGENFTSFLREIYPTCYKKIILKDDFVTELFNFREMYMKFFPMQGIEELTLYNVVLYNYCSLKIYFKQCENGMDPFAYVLLKNGNVEWLLGNLLVPGDISLNMYWKNLEALNIPNQPINVYQDPNACILL